MPTAARRRAILALALSYILFAMLLNSVGTVILQVTHSFGVSKTQASLLEACKDLSIALVSVLLAFAVPRIGYRNTLIAAPAAVAAASVAMPLLRSFGMTEVFFVVVGLAFGLTKVAVYSSIGLLSPDARGHASLTGFIEGLFMVGVVGGGWLFAAFSGAGAAARLAWLNVYWLFAGLAAASSLLWLATPLDEREAAATAPTGWRGWLRDYGDMRHLLLRPLVIVFLISAFLYVLIEQGVGTWLPTFLNEILKLPPVLAIQMTTLFAGSLAAGRLAAGVLLRRVAWFWVLSACVVGMGALVLIVLPLARDAPARPVLDWSHAPVAAYGLPLIGLVMSPIYPTLCSVVLSATPKAKHASLIGLIVVFSALGGTLGSRLTGLVFSRFGGVNAFYAVLPPMLLLLIALDQLRRWGRRAEA
jgi:fucose permease